MNKVIIEFVMGTNMGTKELNLEKYQNLWNIFENLLKDEGLTLSSFAKKWEKFHSIEEENDYKVFYSKLKKQKSRKNTLTTVRADTIDQLQDYIRFLTNDEVVFEALADERFGNIF